MSQPRIFLACPSHGPQPVAAQIFYNGSSVHPCLRAFLSTSVLPHTFNALWCHALNKRSEGITHFAMLHQDVLPEDPFWIDTLIAESEKHDADVMSAVIPLKNSSGLTSTAIARGGKGGARRLTIRECGNLPKTFCAQDVPWADGGVLLPNTGAWVCRFTDPWVERICFQFLNWIDKSPDGTFSAEFDPEDWDFGRQCHQEELNVMATTAVKLGHIGPSPFPNYGEWGQEADV